jgi:transglutaminase-like putative cysteine protease
VKLEAGIPVYSNKKAKYLFIFLLFVLVVAICWGLRTPLKPYTLSYKTQKRLRYSFTVKNETAWMIPQAVLEVYAPMKQTGTQRREAIDASRPFQVALDPAGNQVLRFVFEDLPPYASEIVNIEARLGISDQTQAIAGDPPRIEDLSAHKYVESEDREIAAKALSLKKADDTDTVESIFWWVSRHITDNGYLGNEKGALYAFQHKRGDCTEFADLFAAMCRAVNIPCRRVGGWRCRKSCVLEPFGYHNWAEFYMDGKWHLADPQKRVFRKNAGDYISMHVFSGGDGISHFHYFRVEGEGVCAKMN